MLRIRNQDFGSDKGHYTMSKKLQYNATLNDTNNSFRKYLFYEWKK